MSLIVEDGTGKPDAQTYATEAELTQFATDRGIILKKQPSVLLLLASDYLEAQKYRETPLVEGQALSWPRAVYGLPSAVKRAQLMLAVLADVTDLMPSLPVQTSASVIKRVKVDVIEKEYADVQQLRTAPVFPPVDALLKDYKLGGTFGSAKVLRR